MTEKVQLSDWLEVGLLRGFHLLSQGSASVTMSFYGDVSWLEDNQLHRTENSELPQLAS